MSWYRDPQLFIYRRATDGQFMVARISQGYSDGPVSGGFNVNDERLDFSKHLSTGDNKESDYDAFKYSFPMNNVIWKFINNQGLVVRWDDQTRRAYWSHEEENTPFHSLPGITESRTKLLAYKEALEDIISNLRERNSIFQRRVSELQEKNSNLKVEIQKERDAKILLINALNRETADQNHEALLARLAGLEAQLEKHNLDVTSKLEGCCGAGSGSAVKGPWMSGHAFPSSWVPFEKLDAQTFSENTTLTIIKTAGALNFGVDYTTNVEAHCFYQGLFPIVVVNVAELTPNGEEARFDPDIWGSYNNAGIGYAARKPFASEMSLVAPKKC